MQFEDKTFGHVPKFLSKLTYSRFTSSNPKLLGPMQGKTAAVVKTLRQEREGNKKDNKTKK